MDSSNSTRLLAGLGVAAAALAVQQLLARRRRQQRSAELAADYTKLALLPSERSPVICMSPAMSTVTFFRGSLAAAEKHLAERVAAIVGANPWLASVLEIDAETGQMEAYYPKPGRKPQQKFFAVRKDVQLSREGESATSYGAMVHALAPVLCKPSTESVGTEAPLFSVALLPDPASPNRYAVAVSANHSLLDGHGFYAVSNMLDEAAEVRALRPERTQAFPARMLEATGGEASLMSQCPPGFLGRFIFGQLRAAIFPQTEALAFELSAEWVAAQKAAAAAGGEVPWVSTNDCVVSAFCNCLHPDTALMAANFRGRVEGCGDADVGNYEELIGYMRGDYERPALLRRSVAEAPYRRAGEPATAMLSNWQHFCGGATYGAITNWSTFARPLSLGGGSEQELHLPLFDWAKACPACVFGSLVIFQAAAGRVAAMVAGKQELVDAVRASGMVGKQLDIAM